MVAEDVTRKCEMERERESLGALGVEAKDEKIWETWERYRDKQGEKEREADEEHKKQIKHKRATPRLRKIGEIVIIGENL
jgi:hypothetical protein